MEQLVMMTTLSATLIFSVALALLLEELIFGGLFRLFFGERPPLSAANVPAKARPADLVNRARHSGL
jgi:hypothetical protein